MLSEPESAEGTCRQAGLYQSARTYAVGATSGLDSMIGQNR